VINQLKIVMNTQSVVQCTRVDAVCLSTTQRTCSSAGHVAAVHRFRLHASHLGKIYSSLTTTRMNDCIFVCIIVSEINVSNHTLGDLS